jgi:transcriptional regulator with XRE-family HTH domain
LTSIYDRLSEAIRDLLTEARKKSGLNQAQFAEAVELSQSTVSKIQNGERYILATELVVFARAAGMDPVDLLRKAIAISDAGITARKPRAGKVTRRATKPK